MSAYDRLPHYTGPQCSTENPNDQIATPAWLWNEHVQPSLQWLSDARNSRYAADSGSNSLLAQVVAAAAFPDNPIANRLWDPVFETAEGLMSKAETMDNHRVQPLDDLDGESSWNFDFKPVDEVQTPYMRHDHGMFEGCEAPEEWLRETMGEVTTMDPTLLEEPAVADFVEYAKWTAKLEAAKELRPDLEEGTAAYQHYLQGQGKPIEFDYDEFLLEDEWGPQVEASGIAEVKDAILEHASEGVAEQFSLQTASVGAAAGSENWQKAIGAHRVWLEAHVATEPIGDSGRFSVDANVVFHAEDRYNFNPGTSDVATGTPDNENGRFQEVGLGKEFMQYGEATRALRYEDDHARLGEVLTRRAEEEKAEADQKRLDQLNWPAYFDAFNGKVLVSDAAADPLRVFLQELLSLQAQGNTLGDSYISRTQCLLHWPAVIAKTAELNSTVFQEAYALFGQPAPDLAAMNRPQFLDASTQFFRLADTVASCPTLVNALKWMHGLRLCGAPIPEAWYSGAEK